MTDTQQYTITLTQAQLNVIAAGLAELPFKLAAPVIATINQQLAPTQPDLGATE